MKKYKILVFPCGSEIGLEIYRSLRYSTHVELLGGSSVDDHGIFVFKNYIGNIPFIDSQNLIPYLAKIVRQNKINAIYPTMDNVICKLKPFEKELGCIVISPSKETTEICLLKSKTYNKLRGVVHLPKIYQNIDNIDSFPVFIKPDIGYGSKGVFIANSYKDLKYFFTKNLYSDYVISEYLPGDEYTIDCFSDRKGELRFCGPRSRDRIRDGISVNTKLAKDNYSSFLRMAQLINKSLKMRGAWFFQVKKNMKGNLIFMEAAARIGGSSSLNRARGVNFALLSVYDAFDVDVEIIENKYNVELDRALDNKYKTDLEFKSVYVDFDDCLIINGKVNCQLVNFLYDCQNKKKEIILVTKYEGNILHSLSLFRLHKLFDKIIHINKNENKVDHIKAKSAIFIDDSFKERLAVKKILKIPVFSPDMIETITGV